MSSPGYHSWHLNYFSKDVEMRIALSHLLEQPFCGTSAWIPKLGDYSDGGVSTVMTETQDMDKSAGVCND